MENKYAHAYGTHESTTRAHTWRTATNSCPHLLPHLQPTHKILDIGCGPGTITCDLALLVPDGHVTGIEPASYTSPPLSIYPKLLHQATATAQARGIKNVTFQEGNALELPFEDASFDVVHSHQLLQHLPDPVAAVREMQRVVKKPGIISCRESDFGGMTWWPESPDLEKWRGLYYKVARGVNGGEPEAGRRLGAWCLGAGLKSEGEGGKLQVGAGTWCYSSQEERRWWSGVWKDRLLEGGLGRTAVEKGLVEREEVERIAEGWRAWGEEKDGVFVVLHGEVICFVGADKGKEKEKK